jgi:DNA-binding response OmpR family regulator
MAAKVLVIEDDEGAADLMLALLRKEGLSVEHTEDGKSGIERARVQTPDLVIVDLMLPKMHGFEVIEHLREEEQFKGLPILVVSSKSFLQDVEGAKEVGATEFITKPYDIDKFSDTVRRLLAGKASGEAGDGKANPQSPA